MHVTYRKPSGNPIRNKRRRGTFSQHAQPVLLSDSNTAIEATVSGIRTIRGTVCGRIKRGGRWLDVERYGKAAWRTIL